MTEQCRTSSTSWYRDFKRVSWLVIQPRLWFYPNDVPQLHLPLLCLCSPVAEIKKQREFYQKLGMEVPGDIKGDLCNMKTHLDQRNGTLQLTRSEFLWVFVGIQQVWCWIRGWRSWSAAPDWGWGPLAVTLLTGCDCARACVCSAAALCTVFLPPSV